VARVGLLIFMADFLSKRKHRLLELKGVFLPLMLAISLVCLPIFWANFSTSALVFLVAWLVMFIAGVNWRYLMITLVLLLSAGVAMYFLAEVFPEVARLAEVHSRVDAFLGLSTAEVDTFQPDQAKIAIVNGGLFGLGPGNSIQRNILPNPFSDFAFALIVEEYGLVFGAIPILFLFLAFLVRSVKIAKNASNSFSTYLVIGLALNLVFQALTNICVSVGLFPVTGQNLPFISKGGTSIIIAAIQIGIILNISRNSLKETTEA
jgi:cell division protein FtsW